MLLEEHSLLHNIAEIGKDFPFFLVQGASPTPRMSQASTWVCMGPDFVVETSNFFPSFMVE